jgi:nucleoside-diphosphate-sugar epimerase
LKVLVTGGRGFLGGHIEAAFIAAGHEVVSLGRADGDLAEAGGADRLVAEYAPDAVIHLAAVMPDDARLAQNATVAGLVAAACHARGVPLYHGSSTSVLADRTPYADSKRDSETAVGDATLLRFHYPYGPGQRRGAIPTMLRQARADEDVVVYDGWARSFCFGRDAAEAVRLLVERGERGAWAIGRDDDLRPLEEIARLVCATAGARESLIRVDPPPAGPEAVATPDMAPLRALGWTPVTGLVDGVRRTLDWIESSAS